MIKLLQQNFLRLILLGIFFLGTDAAWSQSIWTNPIDDSTPANHNPYTIGDVKDANITVSGVGRGSGIADNAGTGRYNAKGWTNTTSIDADDYFTFTLTPNSGYKINFASLDFTLQRSNTGPANFSVRSSRDNYATSIETIPATGTTGSPKTVSLSGATFQNITSAITFRIYGYDASGPTGTASINDFTFNGQVVSTLGTTEPERSNVRFYPNPVKDVLKISNSKAITSVMLYNISGQKVLAVNPNSATAVIDMASLASGLYMATIVSDEQFQNIKILKE